MKKIFLLAYYFFYGRGFIHYHKIYNPIDAIGMKVMLLGNKINSKSEFIYESNSLNNCQQGYIYKDEVDLISLYLL